MAFFHQRLLHLFSHLLERNSELAGPGEGRVPLSSPRVGACKASLFSQEIRLPGLAKLPCREKDQPIRTVHCLGPGVAGIQDPEGRLHQHRPLQAGNSSWPSLEDIPMSPLASPQVRGQQEEALLGCSLRPTKWDEIKFFPCLL